MPNCGDYDTTFICSGLGQLTETVLFWPVKKKPVFSWYACVPCFHTVWHYDHVLCLGTALLAHRSTTMAQDIEWKGSADMIQSEQLSLSHCLLIFLMDHYHIFSLEGVSASSFSFCCSKTTIGTAPWPLSLFQTTIGNPPWQVFVPNADWWPLSLTLSLLCLPNNYWHLSLASFLFQTTGGSYPFHPLPVVLAKWPSALLLSLHFCSEQPDTPLLSIFCAKWSLMVSLFFLCQVEAPLSLTLGLFLHAKWLLGPLLGLFFVVNDNWSSCQHFLCQMTGGPSLSILGLLCLPNTHRHLFLASFLFCMTRGPSPFNPWPVLLAKWLSAPLPCIFEQPSLGLFVILNNLLFEQ